MIDSQRIFRDVNAGGFSDAQAMSALTRINWIAQRWPQKGAAQTWSALSANPARVLPMIIHVAIEFGDPIGRLAADWFEKNPNRQTALAVINLLPEQTVALRELAAAVQKTVLEDATDPRERAASLNNLANRLSDLGRREEALAAAQEAAELCRALAQSRPDAFTPNLAGSLNNLALRLSGLGRREEALTAAQEAVRVLPRPCAVAPGCVHARSGKLTQQSGEHALRPWPARGGADGGAGGREHRTAPLRSRRPDAFMPNLAASLNNLANMLSDLGPARRRCRRRRRRWTCIAPLRSRARMRSRPIWQAR